MLATVLPTTTPSPLTISIAGRAGHVFEPQTMLQGFACHARGVEITTATPACVRARVRSKRMHEVDLRAVEGRLIAGCSCPARSMGCRVCKHVWAALLESDRHGGLEDLRQTRGAVDVLPAPLAKAEEPTEAPPPQKKPKSAKPTASATKLPTKRKASESLEKRQAPPAETKKNRNAAKKKKAR